MFIRSLTLNNFKNFTQKELQFSEINCIVGNNGVGKTNILDAIYYLSFCRSFLGCADSEIINYGADFFSLRGDYQLNDSLQESFTVSLKEGGRKVLKHGKQPYKKFSEHIGKIPCVVVSPGDHIYLTGRSESRRKFMDIVLSQTDTVYMDNLINYNKCLLQRNKLLKYFSQSGFYDAVQLEIWDERLSACSTVIQNKRKEFFKEFITPFKENYAYVSGGNEDIDAKYETYEGSLIEILKRNKEKERILCYTSCGIHRDDILFTINGHNASHAASQGQQKTFILALKLSQFDYIQRHNNVSPILLLDDIFDKFDFLRVQKILQLVAGEKFPQVFITDTHPDRTEMIIPANKKDQSTIIKL
ncbi:MAG: DNA replication and repair protein RecF [Bacteroidales bacterium]|nr:DNA replication and repair protein RecF [Bacteroidales bacterium]